MSHSNQLKLIIPPHTIRWFPEGEHCSDPLEADIVLVDHGTIADDVIGLGQEALTLTQPELKGFTWCRHTGVIRYKDGAPWISEMGWHGYERRDLENYRKRLYAVVSFSASDAQRQSALAFDEACEGVDYGWDEYLSLVLDGITDGKFAGSWGDAMFCSHHDALVAFALGCFYDRPPNLIVPAHWAFWTGALVPPEITSAAAPTVLPGDLNG